MAEVAAFLVISALSGSVLLLPGKSRRSENAQSSPALVQSVNLLELRRELQSGQNQTNEERGNGAGRS